MVTSNAPPMTNASVGSHPPATSRKPITLAGFVIPETASPRPKRAPENRATRIFMLTPSQSVTGKEHGERCDPEERRRGRDRAPAETRDAADAVAAGAA